jgi:hypothetical protein
MTTTPPTDPAPSGQQRAARVPNTVAGIRAALPQALRAMFRAELAAALEHGDPATVDAVIGAWWAQAVWHTDPSIRATFTALEDGAEHATATTERPGAPVPPLSVLAVRAELEPFSDLRVFDQEVDTAIRHAAETGAIDRLHTTLRTWLGIALLARYAAEHGSLPREMERRGELQQELMDRWLHEHPAASEEK